MEISYEFNALNVIQTVNLFHTNATLRNTADRWLVNAQNSPEAWIFVWELLQPDKSYEVQFYATNVLHRKISKHLSQIPEDQLPMLKQQLLTCLVNSLNNHKVVINKLCFAVAAYVLETITARWPEAITELISIFQPTSSNLPPQQSVNILLQILSVIPEEFQKLRIHDSDKGVIRSILKKHMSQVFPILEEVLDWQESEVRRLAARCVSSWCFIGVTLPDYLGIADKLIKIALEQAIIQSSSSELIETILDGLTNLLTHPETHNYKNTNIELIGKLMQLKRLIEIAHSSNDRDLATVTYKMYIGVAETHSRLILDTLAQGTRGQETMLELIDIILQCSNSPGRYPTQESTSQLSMGFWYILQIFLGNTKNNENPRSSKTNSFFLERQLHDLHSRSQKNNSSLSISPDDIISCDSAQFQFLLAMLRPVYKALSLILLKKSMLPDIKDDNWSSDDDESLRCYRQDVADTMLYCYTVLHDELLEVLYAQLVEAAAVERTTRQWQPLEAVLHAFLPLAECVGIDEVNVLPRYFSLLQSLPFATLHSSAVETALNTIGAYAEWINKHQESLGQLVPILVQSLGNTVVSPSATMALKDLTRECQSGVRPYAHHILEASQTALASGQLRANECVRLMYTVGRVLALLPFDEILAYLDQILLPGLAELEQLCRQPPTLQTREPVLRRLKMMAMLFASLDLRQSNNQDEGSGDSKSAASQPSNYSDPRRQPVFLILQKILPVLYHFAANWYTEQDVTVAMCSVCKHGLLTLLDDSATLLPDIVRLLLMAYTQRPNPNCLEVSKQVLMLFGPNPNQIELMQFYLSELVKVTLQLFNTGIALSENTDVLDGFYSMLGQIVKRNPGLYVRGTSAHDGSLILQLATLGLGMSEAPTVRACASFLVNAINQSTEYPPLAEAVREAGQDIINKVIHSIEGESPRSIDEPLCDILLALNKRYCEWLSRWLQQTMSSPPYHCCRASKHERDQFASQVLRERANKRRLLKIVQDYSLTARGIGGSTDIHPNY